MKVGDFYGTQSVNWYLKEGMYIRLGRYGLYGILRLRNVRTIDVDIDGGDIISNVALAIRGRSSISLLRFLQATRAKIAIILAGPRQLLFHVVQTGQRQFR